jgi:hypothetical protein
MNTGYLTQAERNFLPNKCNTATNILELACGKGFNSIMFANNSRIFSSREGHYP